MDNMTYDVNELMQLASAQGLEINNEPCDATPKPRYLSPDKLRSHSIVYDMPNKEYHSDPTSISSSSVKKATTPILYARYLLDGFEVKDNTCLIVGTILHALLLESDKQHEFTLYDEQKLLAQTQELMPDTLPENLKRTKEWRQLNQQYKDGNGLFLENVIEKQQFQSIYAVQKRLRKHPEIVNLYHDSKSEASIFASFDDIDVRVRPDLFKIADQQDAQLFEGVAVGDVIILSVKTTKDASPQKFAHECRDNKYALAEAFYQDIMSAVFNKKSHTIYLAVEKDKDQRISGQVVLYQCSEQHIQNGRKEYENNLDVVIHCRQYPNSLIGYEFHNNNSLIQTIY